MKKNSIKTFLCMVIILAAAAVIGTVLLIAVYSLPTGRIKQNVEKSVQQLVEESDHFTLFPGTRTATQDNYSDAEYLNSAMVDNTAKGIFTGLYGIEYTNLDIEIPYDSPVTVIEHVFDNNANIGIKEYGVRFWNGYEVLIKPLLMIFTYGQIRYINYILEAALLLTIILLLHKRRISKYAVPILISFLLLEPVPMAASMSFAGFLYCTYIPCIMMLLFNERLKRKQLYLAFFMMIGISVTYFNMNYFQIITFAYALIFYFLLNGFPKTIKGSAKIFCVYLACWLIGYGGMTILKWVVYEICTGEKILPSMINRALYRVSATKYYTGPHISRFYALAKNIYYLSTGGWMLIEVPFAVYAVIRLKKNNQGSGLYEDCIKPHAPEIMVFVLMVLLVTIRYLLYANHVYVHAWATYRISDAAVLTFNALLIRILCGEDNRYEKISIDNKN